MPNTSPSLISDSFSDDERTRLFDICSDIYFVDALETVRAEYACAMNNTRALTSDRKRRKGLTGHGVDWALNQPVYDKPPSEADIKKTMRSIEKHANKLLDDLRHCGYIEIGVLHDAGLNYPLSRINDELEVLALAANRAQNCDPKAFPKDHRKRASLDVLCGIDEVFGRFDLPVNRYRLNPNYDPGKVPEGGPFWRAAVIVLGREPYPREWLEFFDRENPDSHTGTLRRKKS